MSVCFASARSVIFFLGGVFVPLRGGLSENVLPKDKKMIADISDNARAAYLQTKETIIFRGMI